MSSCRSFKSVALAVLAVVFSALAGQPSVAAAGPGGWRLLPATTSAARNYGQIACAGTSRCWVPFTSPRGGGVGVLATADGGTSWSVEHLPGHAAYLTGISCTSPVDCWVVGYSGSMATRSAGVAFRTVNGGRSWLQLALPAAVGPGFQDQLFGIACHGPNWCAAVGGGFWPKTAKATSCGPGCHQVPVGPPPKGLLALTTGNGGTTWDVAEVPIKSGAELNATSCGAIGACQTVGFGFSNCRSKAGSTSATCSPAGAAARSRKGGASWVPESVGAGIFDLYGVSCPTAAQCWATGSTGNDVQGRGVVLHTTDGGYHWVRQAPVLGSNSLTGISCPTVLSCTAVGGLGTAGHVTPVVETTDNGGKQWSTEAVPPGVSQVVFVTCSRPEHCLAKGIEGYGENESSVLLAE